MPTSFCATALAMTLFLDGTAFRAHPVGPAGRGASRFVSRVAAGALERGSQPGLASFRGENPLALLPGRTVTDVLTVATLEQGHPVPHLVLLEAHHGALHRISLMPAGGGR
jgi:hypothetical protein